MSTRAMYTFEDADGSYNVYKHSDGYPTQAAEALIRALDYAWPLPRYEADDFAAAFVAANKSHWRNEAFNAFCDLDALGRAMLAGIDVTPEDIKQIRDRLEHAREYYKTIRGGGVRLMPSGTWQDVAPHDLEYRYVVSPGKGGQLVVTCWSVAHDGDSWHENKLFCTGLKGGASLRAAAAKAEA